MKPKPHILVISAFDPLPGEPYPAIRYPRLFSALQNIGAECTYLTSDFFHFTKEYRDTDKLRELSKVEFLHVPTYEKNISVKRLINHYVWGKKVLQYLNKQGQKYDLIVSAFPPIHSNYQLAKWSLRNQIPYLIDIQDLWPEAWIPSSVKSMADLIMKPLFYQRNYACRHATAICSVSKDYLNLLASENIPSQVFYLGWNPSKKDVLESYSSKDKQTITVVFIGSSSSLPLIESIIKSSDKIPRKYTFYFIGRSELFLKPPADISENIHIAYDLEEDAKNDILAKADIGLVLVNLRLKSRLPNKVFSYLGAGLKLITNIKGGELQDLIEENDLGEVCDDNLLAFLATLESVGTSVNEMEKNRIKQWAKSNLHVDQIYKRYAAFIMSLIKK